MSVSEGPAENSNSVGNRDWNEKDVEVEVGQDEYFYDFEMARDIQTRNILHWNYRNLREIPREVLQDGEHIQEMYLKRNCITRLPTEIVKLKNLTNIYLIGNQLTSIPEEIGQLRSLKVLDLSQNFLHKLPSSIGDLTELQELLVTQNQIKILPPELCQLHNLKFLEISGNQIKKIDPEIINGLVSLEDLAVDQNPMRFLPRNICQLQKLRFLSVCSGDLEFLPATPICSFAKANRNRQRAFEAGEEIRSSGILHCRFDGNRKLYHLPVWLPQFYGLNLDSFGCGSADDSISMSSSSFAKFTVPKPLQSNVIEVHYGHKYTLHFDEDIRQVQPTDVTEPCTLLESCLRALSIQIGSRKITNQVIPSNLSRLLNTGPTSECFICEQKMFTQVWALIFSHYKENLQNRKLRLSAVHFCGSNCVSYFRRNSRPASHLVLTDFCKYILANEILWQNPKDQQ